jgi:hypothetical protein
VYLLVSSTIDLNNAVLIIPVGLVKDRKPLGHSGHLRLQEVVGSTDRLIGKPPGNGLDRSLEKKKLNHMLSALITLGKVSFESNWIVSAALINIMVNLMNSFSNKLMILLIILSLGSFTSRSQALFDLSEKAEISVITIGPYQGELYSAFGHSAIRVADPVKNIDWVYDYGRFDFDQENFYVNFARGKMLYSIGRLKNFKRFRDYYASEDRFVYEQVLNLSHAEKVAFFKFLERNNQPENRQYLYNYVYDNCGTKIREVVDTVVSAPIRYDYSYAQDGKTVRDLMDDYLAYQPWGDLGIDLGLGMQIDYEAPAEVYMFLPDYVFKGFAGAKIERDTASVALVKSTNVLYETINEPEAIGFFTPFNFFLILFFVIGLITNRNYRTGKRSHWLDVVLFTAVGFAGWWFVFLWVGTEHLSKYNWNLLWGFPLYIPLVYFLNSEKWQPKLARVFRYLSIVLILTIVFWALIPQPMHFSLIPLILAMALRGFYISYDLSRI